MHLIQRFRGPLLKLFDQTIHLFGRVLCSYGKASNLISNNRETAPRLSGAGRLSCSI
jgi:hypothetical protein